MGNQVTTLGQIYPVEYYLVDYCNDIIFDGNLGSTRFMKVARVKHKELGYCVAKVYAINDPSIPIQEHKLKIEQIRDAIKKSGELSSIPFLVCMVNDKCVITLRQHVKYNLYDRLSTRPFLTSIEKRWIAYQLLRCIQSLHKHNIHHGDIKSENILVTSFLWVMLADFASYKPVVLPANNPSDFSYFFDTSRRHCCNMAPERFLEQAIPSSEMDSIPASINYATAGEEFNQLTPQMDLFSLGCVFAELFSDDTPNSSMFDLGQILMYKKSQYDPSGFIEEGINDSRVRRLILNLTDLDPTKRNSATYHLDQLVPSLFPAYFHTLYDYFTKLIPLSPEFKILTLDKDLDKLMEEIITEDEHGLLLPLILASSTLRSLKCTDAKLIGLKLCVRLIESSPTVMSEYIIDRLLPYIVQLLAKSESRVRALCVSSLNSILQYVDKLPASDANVFIDYILPSLLPLAYDTSTLVKLTLASNIAELAETAKRFLNTEDSDHNLKMNLIQEAFGAIVGQLLVDSNNHVRKAVLNENISKLCQFFGPERTDEVILSHIITFLNDKSDFRLRAAFFDNISCIGTSLGPYYAPVVKPLMQKGLADSEEIVIYKCLNSISSMTSSGLLTKEVVYELFQEAVPFLSFPNKWIRNAVINFVLVLSKADQSTIDFNRRILPAIKLHLYRDTHELRDEAVLLDSLQNPLPRVVIESILDGDDDIDEIFHTITKRKMARDKKRYHTISETDSQDFDTLADGLVAPGGPRGSGSSGSPAGTSTAAKSEKQLLANIDRFSEDRLIDSELILRRIHKNKRTSSSRQIEPNISIRRQDAIVQSAANDESRLLMSSTVSLNRTTRPRGILLAHLHEHKGAVNKLIVVPGSTQFVSCSSDATIKFWDCAGVSTKPQVLFKSKQTFVSPDAGAVTTINACMGTDTLLALTENNNLHLLQLYSPSSQSRLIKTVNFNSSFSNCELVTDLVALSPYNYATCSTSSNIRGYDLRLPTTSDIWNLKMDGTDGLITCLDGNEYCIACGTSSSVISMFDLRFYIKATSMSYPPFMDKKKRIRRILICNDEIYCSVDGNNEVSAWDCESASRTKTLWASPAPCLSSRHSSYNSVLSMIVDSSKDTNSVITAGDDMKIRFWDLNNPHRSYIVSQPAYNIHHKLASGATSSGSARANQAKANQLNSVYYQMKLVDGIQVLQETDKLPANVLIQKSSGGGGGSGATTTTTGQQAIGASTGAATGQQPANPTAEVINQTGGPSGSSAQQQQQQGGSAPTSTASGGAGGQSGATNSISASSGQANHNPMIANDSLSLSAAHHDSISCLTTVNQSSLLLSASRDGVIKIWR